MQFQTFDPDSEFTVVWRRLPHWTQPGATYFITWRTKDSMPREVLERWLAERDDWLRKHGIDPRDGAPPGHTWRDQLARLPLHLRLRFRSEILGRWEANLDACYGACVLRRPELSQLVADSLLHFDGQRYIMGDFVVMHNHVHLLVAFPDEEQLLTQCRSWKKFTSTQINKRLGQQGEFWQWDSFDHIVRSEDEFKYYRGYIAENPERAGLREGEYHYYRRPDV